MGNLPLPASSGAGVLRLGIPAPVYEPAPVPPSEPLGDFALLGVLKEAAITGSLSPDVILGAVTDVARVLSGAEGTAIASRNNGAMVCRSRSGSMAPGLGAAVNADSGISGQCLRLASIQICSDASTDDRVDSEVCRALGIRAVAVVPLRGRMGMFGILEAFSSRTGAFEQEQIDSLRSLAEIAEIAYERERSMANPVPATSASAVRAALFPVVRADRDETPATYLRKHYRLFAGILVVLSAMAWIARISWRQTGVEIAASASVLPRPSTSTSSATAQSSNAHLGASGKPEAAILAYPADRSRTRLVESAAVRDRVSEPRTLLTPSKNSSSGDLSTRNGISTSADTLVSAPPVEAAVSRFQEMPKLAPETEPLPQFGGPVSHGAVPATIVERINPIYPWQARSHGIAGDVILNATISQNGSIRKVTVVSGHVSLTDAAVAAVRQWRFSPAMLNGKPVEVQQRITISFKLP